MLRNKVPFLLAAGLITAAAAYAQQAVTSWPYAVPGAAKITEGTQVPAGTPLTTDTTVTVHLNSPGEDPADLFAGQLSKAGWAPRDMHFRCGMSCSGFAAQKNGWEATVISENHFSGHPPKKDGHLDMNAWWRTAESDVTLSVHRVGHTIPLPDVN